MAHFPMTRVPGTLDSAQNDGHQAFQVTTSTWSIDIWSGRKQQITIYIYIKKNNSRNQNLQGSTMGGGQGSTIISRTHSRTLENKTPRGEPILDTSYLRVFKKYIYIYDFWNHGPREVHHMHQSCSRWDSKRSTMLVGQKVYNGGTDVFRPLKNHPCRVTYSRP